MNEIHIDSTILEQEIGVMKELLNIKITETKEDTDNEGKAIEKMKEVQAYYNTLNETLDILIQNTATFLNNAKDAYIETDEASAEILSQLVEGSG